MAQLSKFPVVEPRDRRYELSDILDSFASDAAGAGHVDGKIYSGLKRLADIIISTVFLLILFPLFILVSILIKLEDKGPILYRQLRVGQFGRLFPFYKFRSMRVDADDLRENILHLTDVEGAAFKMKQDPRRTKIGALIRRLSIDEMPQFVLVLVGSMSIIGPRPHLAHEVETYSKEEWERLSVKPGLLCLREIRGRSDLSFKEWLDLDIEYVRTRSLWLDLKIFLLAIPAVISCKGAY